MAGSNFFQRIAEGPEELARRDGRSQDPAADRHRLSGPRGPDLPQRRSAMPSTRSTSRSSSAPARAVVIGLRHLGAGDPAYFAGTIDDARIYDRALERRADRRAAAERQPSQPQAAGLVHLRGRQGRRPDGQVPRRGTGGRRPRGRRQAAPRTARGLPGRHRENADGAITSRRSITARGAACLPTRFPFFWKGEYHVFYLRGGSGRVPWEHIVSTRPGPLEGTAHGAGVGRRPRRPRRRRHVHRQRGRGRGAVPHLLYGRQRRQSRRGPSSSCTPRVRTWSRWTKHPEDIIAPDGIYYKNARVRDFRDPYVFWNEREKRYWMVFFANDAKTGAGVQGLAVSKDLKHWEFQPPLPGAGGQECPDLFQIGDTWYLIGGDHYSIAKDPRGPLPGRRSPTSIDRPFIYAAKRMFDGQRHIWTGWLWDRAPRSATAASPAGAARNACRANCMPAPADSSTAGPCPRCRRSSPSACWTWPRSRRWRSRPGVGNTPPTGLAGSGDAAGRPAPCRFPTITCSSASSRWTPRPFSRSPCGRTRTPAIGLSPWCSGPASRRPRSPAARSASPAASSWTPPGRSAIQAFVQGSMIETFINDQYALSCRGYDYPDGQAGPFRQRRRGKSAPDDREGRREKGEPRIRLTFFGPPGRCTIAAPHDEERCTSRKGIPNENSDVSPYGSRRRAGHLGCGNRRSDGVCRPIWLRNPHLG